MGSQVRYEVESFGEFRVGDSAIIHGIPVRVDRLYFVPGGMVADVTKLTPDMFINSWTAAAEELRK